MERSYYVWQEHLLNIGDVEDYNKRILGTTLSEFTARKFCATIVKTIPTYQGGTMVVFRSSHTCLSRAGVEAIVVRAEKSGKNIFFGAGWVLVNGEEKEKALYYPLKGGASLLSLEDLPYVTDCIREEIIKYHLRRGVIIEQKEGVYVDVTVEIEKGAIIYHHVTLTGKTTIRSGAVLLPYTIIEESEIGSSSIGPFAHIRPKTRVGNGCKIGNFMELKHATIGDGSKASHLSYVGDATIGKNCNIGCGAVFVNYDGAKKYESVVEDGCFIGSNCNIVAPVRMGEGSFLAAGSTLTKDLQAGDLCVARERESIKHNRGKDYYKR